MTLPTKDEIKEVLKRYPFNFVRIIRYKNSDFYNFIKNNDQAKFSERLYCWLNDTTPCSCKSCGKPTKFRGMTKGYSSHCSYKCSNSNITVSDLKKETCIKNYGVDNPSKSDIIKDRIKKTFIENCGVDCNLKLESTQNKIKETCANKYGTDYYPQSDDYKKKIWERNYDSIKNNKFKDILPNFKLEDYKGIEHAYSFTCKKCNTTFQDHMKDGRIPICRKCNPLSVSEKQTEIYNYIKQHCADAVLSDRKTIEGIELDIYIPSKKKAIEYNGNYYHSEVTGKRDRNYHVNKTEMCEQNGIQLIQIFEDEYLQKKDIVYSKINSLLHIQNEKTTRCYARNCSINEVLPKQAKPFIDNNHIQGNDISNIKIGLFHANELIAIMTFGKLRLALGNKNGGGIENGNIYELYRYCSNCTVVGGASKLLNYFIKRYNPSKIISYADRRWSVGNLYEKLGFKLISKTKPNYWYTRNYVDRYHRFNFRKDVLPKKLDSFNPSITEWQNMQNNGWDRIWDCGSLKYEMEITQHKNLLERFL